MTSILPITSNVEDDVMAWLKALETGTVETVVTSEGSRYSFNNKEGRHYLEFIDVTRREPNGRYKRVYRGKIEGRHVTHGGITSALDCKNEYIRWCQTPYGRKGRDNHGISPPA